MTRLIFLALSTLLQLPCFGQISADKTELTDMQKVHTWISELKSGNISWFEAPRDHNFAEQYRLAVGISEIYHTLLVERVLYGKEGCCKRVDKIWKIDLMNVYLKYDTSPEAPIQLGEWVKDTKATFSIGDKQFLIDLSTDTWKIQPVGG